MDSTLPKKSSALEMGVGCVSRLVEAQASRQPDAVAVVYEDRRLSYRELNARANRLARQLVRLGVKPEVLVGICVERSAEMVVGLLAILKAGGAYVPLDPTYPPDRLSFMLRDSGVQVIVYGRSAADRIPASDAVRVVLDVDRELEPGDEENLPAAPSARELMYVIYTSGSTGQPKGVAVEHGSVVNLVSTSGEDFGFGPSDVWTVVHSFGFDFSVWEIWGCLCNGGRLVVVPGHVAQSPVAFYDLLRRERVTVLNQIPSALRNFLVSASADCDLRVSDVRLIVCGGEAFPRELAAELLAWNIPLWNFYGPTEATVWATNLRVTSADFRGAYVPIGHPMRNVTARVLDEDGAPVPAGSTGELYLGGPGLARGYWKRSDLTAQRFIPDPFSDNPGARLYRTGDLARAEDGCLEFVGRIDTQVKVRGYRIELGEIEAAIVADPAIREAVVVAREAEPEVKRLIAYVVTAPGRATATWELRERLRKRLPEYMVPSAFVVLEKFPLNANGKIDRAALPLPEKVRPQTPGYAPPRDAVEIKLGQLWEKVLGVEPVGMNDDFFELGGHSLMAVRLFVQIEKTFGLSLPLAAIFQARTLAQLAALVRQEGSSPSWSLLVPIQTKGTRPPLYCVHALGGNVLSYGNLSRHLGSGQPFYGLQSKGLDGKQPPNRTVPEMAAQYVEAIRRLQPQGPYFLAGWSFGGKIAFEMARLLHADGQEVGLLALIDSVNAPPPAAHEQGGPIRHASRRLRIQLGAMRRLSPGQWIAHFGKKAAVAARWAAQRIRERAEERSIPEPLRVINAANDVADRVYVGAEYEGGAILFRGSSRIAGDSPDPSLGWASAVRGGLEIVDVPGDHFSLVEEPHAQVLARELAARIDGPPGKGETRLPPAEVSSVPNLAR
jgi:amino acid adenylation domain-containing protein